MLKKYTLIIVGLVASYSSIAQLEWMNSIHIKAGSTSNGIAVDASGNVYLAGRYWDYDDNSYIPVEHPGSYLAKYTSSGSLIWSDTTVSSGSGVTCGGVVSDASGNAYVSIWIGGPSSALNTILIGGSTYSGGYTMYLIKYSPTGNVLWVLNQGNAETYAMKIDNNGYIFLAGASAGGGFIKKYDNSGNCLLTIPTSKCCDLGFDGYGNIYVNAGVPNSIKKYNSIGNLIWSRSSDIGKIAVDEIGNCYFTNPRASVPIATIKKYDPNGNVLWTLNPTNGAVGNTIAIAEDGTFYVGGRTDDGTFYLSMDIAQYDSTGNQIWYFSLNNLSPYEEINTPDQIIQSNGSIYISGFIDGVTNFGRLYKILENITTGAKETGDPFSASISPNPSNGVFQINYSSSEKTSLQINIVDSNGQNIYRTSILKVQGDFKKDIDLSKQPKGIYFIEIIADKKRQVKKIVLN